MGGRSGSDRVLLSRKDTALGEARAQHASDLASGRYDTDNCYLSPNGVAVLCDKGRKTTQDEFEAAKAMANDGILVFLTLEHGKENATGMSSKGHLKFSDGRLTGQRLSYEQSTPKSSHSKGAYVRIKECLEHSRKKGSDVAVIYDKYWLFHRGDIRAGIKEYERHDSNRHRFMAIVVIDKKGGVHEHGHSK